MALDTIADRYAEAYFAQARDDQRLPDALAELQQLRRALRETPRLDDFLGNPEIAPAEKRALLAQAFGPAMSAQTLNLVDLVVANGRSQHLTGVAEAFEARWRAAQGVQRVLIQTARRLPSALITRVRQRIEALLHIRAEVETEIEPSLLGGARVTVGHQEFDGTLRRRLRDLRERWKIASLT